MIKLPSTKINSSKKLILLVISLIALSLTLTVSWALLKSHGLKPPAEPDSNSNSSDNSATGTEFAADQQTVQIAGYTMSLFKPTEDGPNAPSPWMEIHSDAKPAIDKLTGIDGNEIALQNLVIPQNSSIEKVNWIPQDQDGQLLFKSAELLPAGEGTFSSESVYRIQDGKLQQILSAVTNRIKEQSPAMNLTATLASGANPGELKYTYTSDDEKDQTVVLKWDGKTFADPTGKYKALQDRYRP